ncbi:MAG TPA: DNA polymerase III subunit gamma/tau [Acidimicrobiales bacterium]|jgi:DNA polymerase-3 subunit gamma/tau|nr:DNA polymerase III subunit gamma/tau [Acidimicrobiales bacterium]
MSGDVAENFQSLYRRYRPQRFSEVRGQPHVVMALSHAVRDERVAHAYLFSGPRGTGKTSTARILAKALNCQSPKDGEPCGECDSCVDIARGASLDVHELDAASNNGVDAMRDLVARASLATPGKWKVYIVDEVHTLSTAASNALLKTLEEPPSHVVFVLATTDPQKVLATIKSRTQHFEFHLFDTDVLSSLLTDIAADAALELPPDGIEAAVRRGHGSARDALSALDQVAAAGVVSDDGRFVQALIESLAEPDTGKALTAVAEAVVAGLDAPRLAADLIDGLRAVFLGAISPSAIGAEVGPDGRPMLSPARSVRALEVIGTAVVDMREALDARTCFEVALVRLTHPDVDDTSSALVDRLDRLERRLSELAAAVAAGGAVADGGASGPPANSAAPAPARASGRSGSSPALGAFRSSQPPGGSTTSPPAPPARARPGREAGDEPADGSLQPGESPSGDTIPPSPVAVPVAAEAPSAAGDVGAMPSRDDLVAAWGDHILSSLRAKPRAVFAAGHFVASEGDIAVFALPTSAQVAYAEPLVNEVADVLSRYFRRSIGLKLVFEDGSLSIGSPRSTSPRPPASSGSTAAPLPSQAASRREEEYEDLEDLQPGEAGGNHDPVSWAASRLLEAFPGAEEVP